MVMDEGTHIELLNTLTIIMIVTNAFASSIAYNQIAYNVLLIINLTS